METKELYLNGEELSGEIVIPNTVTEIKSYAFYYCDKITSVIISDSVITICSLSGSRPRRARQRAVRYGILPHLAIEWGGRCNNRK